MGRVITILALTGSLLLLAAAPAVAAEYRVTKASARSPAACCRVRIPGRETGSASCAT